jgi:hypothetical protein
MRVRLLPFLKARGAYAEWRSPLAGHRRSGDRFAREAIAVARPRAAASDDGQHCDGGVARAVLLRWHCGSEAGGPFAGSAIPANAVALAQTSIRADSANVRPLPERTTSSSASATSTECSIRDGAVTSPAAAPSLLWACSTRRRPRALTTPLVIRRWPNCACASATEHSSRAEPSRRRRTRSDSPGSHVAGSRFRGVQIEPIA